MSRRVAGAVLMAMLAMTSCGGDPAEEEVATTLEPVAEAAARMAADDDPTGSDAEDERAAAKLPVVTLLDAGAEPRREVRIATTPGTSWGITTRQEMAQTASAQGTLQDMGTVVTEADMTFTVESVDDRRIVVAGVYDDIRVVEATDPSTADATEQAIAQLEGASVRQVFDPRANLLEVEMDSGAAAALDPLGGDLMSQARATGTPVPAEPIGVGAVWETTAEAVSGGLPMEISARHRVIELTDERITLESEVTIGYPPGEVEVSGQVVEVVGGEISGSGTMSLSFAMPAWTGRTEFSGSMRFAVEPGGVRQEMVIDQQQRVDIRLRP